MSEPETFHVGDVVYAEGASGILGDVLGFDRGEGLVEIQWRSTVTHESVEDIRHTSVALCNLALVDRFGRYVAHGRRAVETHPDYRSGGVDFQTAALDTIASILHALDDENGHPEREVGDETSIALDRAYGGYVGDFEDVGR